MTKNGIIGLLVVTIVVLGGLTFYTQSEVSNQIDQVIEASHNGQVQITLESETQGMFSGSAHYKVTLSPDTLQQLAPTRTIDDAIELYVNHSYTSYPLFVSSVITLDLTQGIAKDFMDIFPDQNIEYLFTSDTNLLTQSQSAKFVIEPTTLKNDDVIVTLGSLTASLQTDLALSSGDRDLQLDFEKIVLDLGHKGLFSLSGLASTVTIGGLDDILAYVKSSVMTLAHISFVDDVRQVEVDIKNLLLASSNTDEKSDVISSNSLISIESVIVNNAISEYDVTNTTIDITISNIDKVGLLAFDSISRDSNPAEIMDALKPILTRGLNGAISKLNTTVNTVNLTSSGEFKWPAYTGDDLQAEELMSHFMTGFRFDYSANLSSNYGEVFPQFGTQIDRMKAHEFIKADDQGNLSTAIKMEAGVITVNDKRIM